MKLVAARRHDGGRCLPLADPAPLCRAGGAASCARRAAVCSCSRTAAWPRRGRFQGKDAILSGPAGGIVGAARTAAHGRLRPASSASTWAAPPPTSRTTPASSSAPSRPLVAGVRMRAPMMAIHTVAAGGGSILHFDGARYRVGPGQRRRRSGPGLLPPRRAADRDRLPTSCVGKIQPRPFPGRVRPGRRRSRSTPRSCGEQFAALAAEIAAATGTRRDPRAVAEGFLRDRRRQHGERHQAGLGAARPRRHPLRAAMLRRRRRPACLPGGRRARHGDGVHPPASPACSRPMAWAWPTRPRCASAPSRRRFDRELDARPRRPARRPGRRGPRRAAEAGRAGSPHRRRAPAAPAL